MLIALLLSCSDPDFGHLGTSLEAYERGILAMERGDSQAAVDAFQEAVSNDPDRPTLRSWEARSLVEAGFADQAIASLNRGLVRFPDDAVMRYQRAALLAKRGDVPGAVEDLRWLYANEQAHPIEVGEDPDFRGLKVDPLYAELVPDAHVDASVVGQQGSVLVGDSYTVEFTITSRTGVPVQLKNQGDDPAAVRVQRVVEDIVDRGEIWTRRTLLVELRAMAEGAVAVGPWFVEAGHAGRLTERLVVDIVSIPNRPSAVDTLGMSLVVPSTRWGTKPDPYLGRQPDGVWAVVPTGMYMTPSQSKLGPKMEFREGGQPRWTAAMVDADTRIELRFGDQLLHAWPPGNASSL